MLCLILFLDCSSDHWNTAVKVMVDIINFYYVAINYINRNNYIIII